MATRKTLTRVYHRNEPGLIEVEHDPRLSEEQYLDERTVHGYRPVSQGTDTLTGWPDNKVEWYGYDKDGAGPAIGFPR